MCCRRCLCGCQQGSSSVGRSGCSKTCGRTWYAHDRLVSDSAYDQTPRGFDLMAVRLRQQSGKDNLGPLRASASEMSAKKSRSEKQHQVLSTPTSDISTIVLLWYLMGSERRWLPSRLWQCNRAYSQHLATALQPFHANDCCLYAQCTNKSGLNSCHFFLQYSCALLLCHYSIEAFQMDDRGYRRSCSW